jgi:signal transduction histidine kinase
MGGTTTDAVASRRPRLLDIVAVAALGATATGTAHLIGSRTDTAGSSGLETGVVIALALASGLFLTAGVLRLVKWRLERDQHSVLVGTALIVMGVVCLPLGGIVRHFVTAENSAYAALATHGVTAFVVMGLVVHALGGTDGGRGDARGRLLPGLLELVGLALVLAFALRQLAPHTPGEDRLLRLLLSAGLSLGWFVVAAQTARKAGTLPWARRAAPLFLAMGLAETLRALDPGHVGAWTLAGSFLCAAAAAVATLSALTDLDQTMSTDEQELTALAAALQQAHGEADELSIWREQLTHDARNACAGLRAAMTLLERYDGKVDPGTTERLRLAAVHEIGHLEHLITRSSTQPCERFEVSDVVRGAALPAQALGSLVTFHGRRTEAIGRRGDLAAVLKNLLVNVETHAPGSRIAIAVTSDEDKVTITLSDDGPGLTRRDAAHAFERGYRGRTSPGSGLGLFAARELMREQGGDLDLGEPRPGATFHLTLLAAPAEPPAGFPLRIPAQRTLSPSPGAPAQAPALQAHVSRAVLSVSEIA